jgi:hypothetical protein
LHKGTLSRALEEIIIKNAVKMNVLKVDIDFASSAAIVLVLDIGTKVLTGLEGDGSNICE